MSLLEHQSGVSNQSPMLTDRGDDTSVVSTSTSETVVWLYDSSGWTAASGQAAGTIVTYKTTYTGILNSVNATLGHSADTSLSFGAATRAAQIVNVPESVFSAMQKLSVSNQVTEITKWLTTAGDYAIDHRRGQVWCNSKATVANDAITYDYLTPLTGGGAGDKIDLIKVGGVSVPVDDAAFTAGTTPVQPIGFLADQTSTDSVDEGDIGVARMTLDRKQIIAGYDSAADTNKTFETAPIWTHHIEETLATITNETSGTNYRYIDMDGFDSLSIQIDTGGTAPTDTLTITLEASNQDDGTAAASCFYTDITTLAYDAATGAIGTASWVDVDMMAFLAPPVAGTFKYVRVKTVTAGGSNDQDYTIYAKKAYI
jgi:hypothetical protein